MAFKDIPIQKKFIRIILLTTCAVLSLTCTAYFAYEFFTFRHTTIRQLSTLGQIIASNSTAALAFDSREDAKEILSAIKADKHIVAACLYDAEGNLFSQYPEQLRAEVIPGIEKKSDYYFEQSYLVGFEPVVQGERRLGTLYLKSDMGAMYERFMLYGIIAVLVIAISLLMAYLLSKRLQKQITAPILGLAETAKAISNRQDYSVRATKLGDDEIGLLTDAFNHMLGRIEEQTAEITSFNQKLEQNVRQRTAELQLANKELEAFSYSVSHDLRSPLRSIHGYMNIFLEEYTAQLDNEGKRLIDIIISNSRKMGQLIDDLLAFSQLGRKALQKTMVSMNDMVSGICEEFIESEKDRKIDLRLLDMPPGMADSVTIKQVWLNLISNAFKYTMNNADARIEIGAQDSGDEVVYYVRDNGAGFDMRYYDKLFGVFQRLHSEEEFEGTGVGLAIVERVISKHGGKIWAESKLDEGSTFYFTLAKVAVVQ